MGGGLLGIRLGVACPVLFCHGYPYACVACPLGIIQIYSASLAAPAMTIGFLMLSGLFIGRAACGWLCPFGLIQDLLAKQSSKKLRRVWWVKFASLALAVLASAYLGSSAFCAVCPAGTFWATIPYVLEEPSSATQLLVIAHFASLALVIALSIRFMRFWCRYLCPLGSMGAFNKVSRLTILRGAECTNCGACLSACPMGIEQVREIGVSTDCVLCGLCVDACPLKCLRLVLRKGV